jgi:hypothetical protein
MRDLSELVDAYMEQENLHRLEGRKGVEAICQLAAALGYKDPTYFGQLTSKATVGDLLCMLEDNPGMVEVMVEWVRASNSQEHKESLEALVKVEDAAVDQYEGGVCPDCGEEISPTAVRGDECDNCGHVFNWGESDDPEWDEMEPLFPNGV